MEPRSGTRTGRLSESASSAAPELRMCPVGQHDEIGRREEPGNLLALNELKSKAHAAVERRLLREALAQGRAVRLAGDHQQRIRIPDIAEITDQTIDVLVGPYLAEEEHDTCTGGNVEFGPGVAFASRVLVAIMPVRNYRSGQMPKTREPLAGQLQPRFAQADDAIDAGDEAAVKLFFERGMKAVVGPEVMHRPYHPATAHPDKIDHGKKAR